VRPSKFTDAEILEALAQVRDGTPAVQVCRRLGITETTFYRWRNSHEVPGGADARDVREVRDENQRLRQIVANLLLEQQRATEGQKRK
jgi:putative transposase